MIKGILRPGTTKNFIIITGKCKNLILNSKTLGAKSSNFSSSPIFKINFTQKRFCSSASSTNALHKVLFVNAESPEPLDANSTSNFVSESFEYIPPPPPIPLENEEIVHVLNALGEPTFQSLGLASSWTPVGWIQTGLEFLHVSTGLPWWGTIAVATVIMRTLLFPLVIKTQRNNAIMNKHLPTMQAHQMKITEARNSGNTYEASKAAYDLQEFMKKNNLNPLRSMIVPMAQAPIFLSMFIGLRKCANLPVQSFAAGGMLWFVDLTMADPYYLLPLITSATLFVTIEVGADGQKIGAVGSSKILRHCLRALPVIMFPFIMNFPAAILCYWMSTNFISLIQVAFLRIPAVRTYFKIDPLVKHSEEKLPIKSKGVIKDVKESWSNMKVVNQLSDRQRIDALRFKKAGMGPAVKTYKQNPVQMNAKKRD